LDYYRGRPQCDDDTSSGRVLRNLTLRARSSYGGGRFAVLCRVAQSTTGDTALALTSFSGTLSRVLEYSILGTCCCRDDFPCLGIKQRNHQILSAVMFLTRICPGSRQSLPAGCRRAQTSSGRGSGPAPMSLCWRRSVSQGHADLGREASAAPEGRSAAFRPCSQGRVEVGNVALWPGSMRASTGRG
jgi:hypothetical protein